MQGHQRLPKTVCGPVQGSTEDRTTPQHNSRECHTHYSDMPISVQCSTAFHVQYPYTRMPVHGGKSLLTKTQDRSPVHLKLPGSAINVCSEQVQCQGVSITPHVVDMAPAIQGDQRRTARSSCLHNKQGGWVIGWYPAGHTRLSQYSLCSAHYLHSCSHSHCCSSARVRSWRSCKKSQSFST